MLRPISRSANGLLEQVQGQAPGFAAALGNFDKFTGVDRSEDRMVPPCKCLIPDQLIRAQREDRLVFKRDGPCLLIVGQGMLNKGPAPKPRFHLWFEELDGISALRLGLIERDVCALEYLEWIEEAGV